MRRSRFITYAGHAPTEDAARAFLEGVRTAHPDATHHCWAYNAGPPGTTARVGMSDDGEPHGTAGRPMLTALLHADVGEAVIVCVRYYGGTKLGTGGLARAYTSGAQGALDLLRTRTKVDWADVTVVVPYAFVDVLERTVASVDGRVGDRDFGASVTFGLSIPSGRLDGFERAVADATRGEATIQRRET